MARLSTTGCSAIGPNGPRVPSYARISGNVGSIRAMSSGSLVTPARHPRRPGAGGVHRYRPCHARAVHRRASRHPPAPARRPRWTADPAGLATLGSRDPAAHRAGAGHTNPAALSPSPRPPPGAARGCAARRPRAASQTDPSGDPGREQEPQKAPQRVDHRPGRADCQPVRFRQHERMRVSDSQRVQPQIVRPAPRTQEPADHAGAGHRRQRG